MKPASHFFVVLVTAPDLKTARTLSKSVLQARLAACANLVPKMESHYWWQGKLETSAETLIIFKTTKARLPALKQTIAANHPYETPEFLAFEPKAGSKKYLQWLATSCGEK